MTIQTTPDQRRAFFTAHQCGQTYAHIAAKFQVSTECVRYWCRRQRDGGSVETRYAPRPSGPLDRFHARVRLVILRLRLRHPRWGRRRLHQALRERPSLRGLDLPSPPAIGRYLHQWPRFRRPVKVSPPSATAATATHPAPRRLATRLQAGASPG